MFIDPQYLALGLSVGIALMGYLIGRNALTVTKDVIISDTIEWLCDEGYIKHSFDEDDDIVIKKLSE